MKTALTKTTILASLLVVASAWIMQSCSGDDGSKGDKGETGANGAGCTAASNANGVTITCGSDVYTLTNGEKGDKGEGACTATTGLHPETGVQSIIINCGNGPQYVAQGGSGSASGIDCELIVDESMAMGEAWYSSSSGGYGGVQTGVNSKGARQTFSVKCGNGTEAKIGFCGQYNDVFNPKTEKCIETTLNAGDWHIVPGIGKCKTAQGVQTYVMSEQFCQDPEGNSAIDEGYDDDDQASTSIGTVLKPVCSGDTYDAKHFCYGYQAGVRAGIVTAKCGNSVASAEYDVWQFCLITKPGTTPTTATYAVTPRCGYSAATLPTTAMINGTGTYSARGIVGSNVKLTTAAPYLYPADVAGFNGPSAFDNTQFCQDGTNQVLSLCGGKTYAAGETCLPENEIGGLCGDLSYNLSRSFCATQDTKIYALCGTTSAEGKFNPTTSFCWSGDFSTSNTDSANAYGQIRDLCNGVASISSSSSAVDTTWKMQGYYTSQFCSAQNNKIYDLCGQKTAYNTDNYFCTKSGAGQMPGTYSSNSYGGSSSSVSNVLSGKCQDGNLTNPYNLSGQTSNGLTCSTNKVYRACYGGSQNTSLPLAYDGPDIGAVLNSSGEVISVGYVGTASQICTSPGTNLTAAPAVTCKTPGAGSPLTTKDGVVGCVCDISTDSYMDTPSWDGTDCVTCGASNFWSPADNGGRGKCVSALPVNSQSGKKSNGTTDNNIATCITGSWKVATDADVLNTSDAIYTAVTTKGQMFCH